MCKNCFKTREEHSSSIGPPRDKTTDSTDPNQDPNQRDIIRKCLAASANPKLRHSMSLENVSSNGKDDHSFGGYSRRSVSPGLGDKAFPGNRDGCTMRPATPFVGNRSVEMKEEAEVNKGVCKAENLDEQADEKKDEISDEVLETKQQDSKPAPTDLANNLKGDYKTGDGKVEPKSEDIGKKKNDDVFSEGGLEKAKQTFSQQPTALHNLQSTTPTSNSEHEATRFSEHVEMSCCAELDDAIGSRAKFLGAGSQINNSLPNRTLNSLDSVNQDVNRNNNNKINNNNNKNDDNNNKKIDEEKFSLTQKTNSLTPENSNDLPVKCDNRASFEPGKDRPSPVEFYYDGSRIEHRESDDNFQNRESTLISVNTDNHTNHHTPAFSSTLKVSVANKTIQLDPQVIADVTDDNLIEDRRYISYLANDPIGNKESNFSTLRNSQRTLRKYCDDTDMSYDFLRSEAMMEGQKLLMESLRERNSSLEEQFQKMEREKTAIIDLLTNKKNDYERMKEHYNATIFDLDSQVQRLTSEKNRLLERLQLPESERSSLAAEEKEIYELRRKLDDYENRLIDLVGENEELRQEVKDAYLEKAELHDQFRDEETLEFRELQKELEAAAKNYRILQFKLRKAERHNEQLENDRIVYEEKLRHFESCIQSSDDKRRLRKLEEELRSAKEAHQRIQDELGKTEEKRRRAFEDLDRTKNSLNEADSKRLCLQNEVDNMRHEVSEMISLVIIIVNFYLFIYLFVKTTFTH